MVICDECKGTKRTNSGGRWVPCGACERREAGIVDVPVNEWPAFVPDSSAAAIEAQIATSGAALAIGALESRLATSEGHLTGVAAVLNTWGREAYGVAEEDVSKLPKFAENLRAMTTRAIDSVKARADVAEKSLAIVTAELEAATAPQAPEQAVAAGQAEAAPEESQARGKKR